MMHLERRNMATRNPFTPSFGKVPPHMAGREQLISELRNAIESGPGDPNLSMLVIGARGTGKTALLTRVSREAQALGWVSADVSARPRMLESIWLRAKKASSHLVDLDSPSHLTGLQLGQIIGVEWESETQSVADWRLNMEALLDQLEERDSGLLITVDEVRADLPEMIELVSVYQHFVREDRRVALLMAGLPFKVSELLSNEDISFLRRAQHRYLGRIPDVEISEALRSTIEDEGRTIGLEALGKAVAAIDGFPYMMQLVGYRAWAQHPGQKEISVNDILRGVELATGEMTAGVFEATFRELSPRDKDFLFAMLEDGDVSVVTEIASRMGVKGNYAGQYKRRLLEQGLIGDRGYGRVAYELPGFRRFLESKRNGAPA